MPKIFGFGRKSKHQDPAPFSPSGYALHPDVARHFRMLEKLMAAPASKQERLALELTQFAPQAIEGFKFDYRRSGATHSRPVWHEGRVAPQSKAFELPSHPGFERLAINAEKEKNYQFAIEVSRQAKQQGWRGDWDKRIERCQVKAAKNGGGNP